MKFFLQLFLFMLVSIAPAQHNEADSLEKHLPATPADTQKVNILNRLARLHEASDPPRSLNFALQANKLAKKLNFSKGLAFAIVYEADYYYFQGKSDTAEKKYEQAIALFRSIDYKPGLAWTYMVAGNNFTNDGRYEKAMEYVLKSVALNEQTGNQTGYAWALQTAGGMFTQLGMYDKARDYTNRALALMKELKNAEGIASCYNTLGIMSDYSGDYPKALEYYHEALEMRTKSGNTIEAINVKANIGVVYFYMQQYHKAIQYLREAMRMARQAGQPAAVASALINLGEAYRHVNNFTLSVASLKEGITLAGELGSLEYKREGVRLLSETLFAMGDYKNAYQQELLYTSIKDSILEESNTRQILEMNSKYESERKDRELVQKDAEISRQQAENQQRSLQRNTFVVAFAGMLACALFIFRSYRQNHRINIEVTRQKDVIEQKQKEILDSIHYARRIQRALITPERYIERVLSKRSRANG